MQLIFSFQNNKQQILLMINWNALLHKSRNCCTTTNSSASSFSFPRFFFVVFVINFISKLSENKPADNNIYNWPFGGVINFCRCLCDPPTDVTISILSPDCSMLNELNSHRLAACSAASDGDDILAEAGHFSFDAIWQNARHGVHCTLANCVSIKCAAPLFCMFDEIPLAGDFAVTFRSLITLSWRIAELLLIVG